MTAMNMLLFFFSKELNILALGCFLQDSIFSLYAHESGNSP